jgi:Putative beta-barrel porin-2, OmpL-like. bbp2
MGLVKWMTGCVVALVVAAAPPAARAGEGPSASEQPASAPAPSGFSPAALALAASGVGEARDLAPTPAAEKTDDPAPAPDFLHSLEVYGLVDGYYTWSSNKTGPQLYNFNVNHNNFTLSYVELALAKSVTEQSRAGFRVDFGAGDTADLVDSFEPGGTDYLKYVQQAYVSYLVPAGKGLTVDFGKFVTPIGGEVIESKDNFNYSRGILFAWAIPYYHMGARVGYAVNDKVSVTGFLVNGWNNVIDNNGAKTVAGSVTVKPNDKTSIIGNYMVGKEQTPDDGTRNLFDVVVSYSATDKVSVLGNFDYGHDKVGSDAVNWSGLALGVKYQANDAWAFSPRYEIFKDSDGFSTGTVQTLQEITLTGEYKTPEGLIARFEFRNDFSGERFFEKASGAMSKTQPTLTFALIYAFSNK